MFDYNDITSIAVAIVACYTKYVHGELKERPTKDWLEAKLENIETKIDNIKEDVQEIKQNQERTESDQ